MPSYLLDQHVQVLRKFGGKACSSLCQRETEQRLIIFSMGDSSSLLESTAD